MPTTTIDWRIDYLADYPEFIDTLAAWHHGEWSYLNPASTLEERSEALRLESGGGSIPATVVAHRQGVPLGSASLVVSDMDARPDLTPWLASVFVASEHRRRGIASALVRRIEEEAASLGFGILYLFTMDQERLYARLGWKVLERISYRGTPVVVMVRQIGSAGR